MKITFLGAAKTVTGSNFLVEAAGKKFLVDCGLYQGQASDELHVALVCNRQVLQIKI